MSDEKQTIKIDTTEQSSKSQFDNANTMVDEPELQTPSNRGRRRNTILDRKMMARRYHSYRPLSPSRFLEHPLIPNPSVYTHASLLPTTNPNSITSIRPSISLHQPIPPAGQPISSLLTKERADTYLDAIANLYYRKRTVDSIGAGDDYSSQNYDLFQYSTLQLLLSPLREPSSLDSWTPKEIALFEAGMCSIGKDFYQLHKLIETKSTNECVEFYYTWKKSAHFAIWKKYDKQSKGMNLPMKLAHWEEIDEKLSSLTTPVHALKPWTDITVVDANILEIGDQEDQKKDIEDEKESKDSKNTKDSKEAKSAKNLKDNLTTRGNHSTSTSNSLGEESRGIKDVGKSRETSKESKDTGKTKGREKAETKKTGQDNPLKPSSRARSERSTRSQVQNYSEDDEEIEIEPVSKRRRREVRYNN